MTLVLRVESLRARVRIVPLSKEYSLTEAVQILDHAIETQSPVRLVKDGGGQVTIDPADVRVMGVTYAT